jgi:hypothetical protein
MKHELYSRVALRIAIPQYRLQAGDVATIVECHSGHAGQEPGYSLEVFNAVGETIAVVTLRESEIEPLAINEILHVRRFDEVPA